MLQCGGALAIALRDLGSPAQVGAAAVFGLALYVSRSKNRHAALAVAVWFAGAAVLQAVTSDDPLGWTAVLGHGARVAVPLAIARPERAALVLRIGASMTYFGHGIEALGLHPKFLGFIQVAGGHVGLELADVAPTMLRVIGSVDVAVAALFLRAGPRPMVAGYMSVWATIAALARTVYAGPIGIADTLLRAPYAAAPLWLFLRWRGQSRTGDSERLADDERDVLFVDEPDP